MTVSHSETVPASMQKAYAAITGLTDAFCREHLANFKVPKIVESRDSLPKTSTGKISRRDLV